MLVVMQISQPILFRRRHPRCHIQSWHLARPSRLDKDHFTIVAALRAKTFTYEFTNDSGATVQFAGPEAASLFQANASVDVKVAADARSL